MDRRNPEDLQRIKKQNRSLQHIAEETGLDFWLLNRLVRMEGYTPAGAAAHLQAGGMPKPAIKTGRTKPPLPPGVRRKRKDQNKVLRVMADVMELNFKELHRLVRVEGLTPVQAAERLSLK
jgi:hypothetical protein